MGTITYTLSIPTDNGFIGRECSDCKKYFKVELDAEKEHLFCPYCGIHQANDLTWTRDQQKAIDQTAEDFAMNLLEKELDKMFSRLARGNKYIKYIKYSPGPRTRIKPITHHLERPVDSEIQCSNCKIKFQVFGIFGYCPGCKEENINIYDVNLEIIRNELKKASEDQRTLRHAYNDLVSTFEGYCKKVATRKGLDGPANFQNLKNTRDFFKDSGIDIFINVSDNEKIDLKRVFEKRHLYQHGDGVINEKYVIAIPQDRKLMGTKATLSEGEFLTAVGIIKKVLRALG